MTQAPESKSVHVYRCAGEMRMLGKFVSRILSVPTPYVILRRPSVYSVHPYTVYSGLGTRGDQSEHNVVCVLASR